MYLISLTELSGSKKIEQNIAPGSGIDLEYETDGKTLWKYFFLSVKLVFMNSIQLIWLFGYDKHVAQHWLVHVYLISCQYLDRCDLVTCLQQYLMYWGSHWHIFGHLIIVISVQSISPEGALYETCYVTAHKGPCRAGAFHSSGKLIATGSEDASIKVW